MKFKPTNIEDAYIIETLPIKDERGSFTRMFCQREFAALGLKTEFVQCNEATSKLSGTFRGFHYQRKPSEQAKLIRCTRGTIYNYVIDIRKDSPTYKTWIQVQLNEANGLALYVPPNCANAHLTLENYTTVLYMSSDFYTPELENGIRYNDPFFNVITKNIKVISPKDLAWADYKE